MASTASSSSDMSPEEKRYDVFLSFRGDDTRNQFASYLYEALHEKQIITFMDDKLERGDEISPALRKAIEDSMISVVVLSEKYAASTWCLDELVHILDCKKRNGQAVIPIFYNVDPSTVRKQEGSYGVAFAQLEERFKDRMEKLLLWRAALTEVADLSGLASTNFGPENQLIQKIVEDVLLKLPKYSSWNIDHCKDRLFGIQEHIKKIEKLLCFGSTDVRMIGIWGMGGVGKTTLASVVFQKFSYSHFEGRSYLWNVRQEYECFGPNYLRKHLLRDLIKDEAIVSMDTPFIASPFILDRLRRKKVLIILDDVDSSIQLETLIEGYHQLAPGSRIIVTTRNKQVLVKADGIHHKVEGLNNTESLKLFHLHAFGKDTLATNYETLSEKVTSYANGNPLALRVLGSFLHSRLKQEWESTLEKLKRVPKNDIVNVLRISYEGLDYMEKNIFLDIAFFFDQPFYRQEAENILYGGDSCAKIGISVLIDKSLIQVSHSDKSLFSMHDLVRQMGWSIVSDEHKKPGNRSRLRGFNDVCQVLESNTETETVEIIVLNLSELERDVKVRSTAFKEMCNLRILKICGDNIGSNKCKLYLPKGLDCCLSNKLRYFQWDFYPLNSLPSDFTPEELVVLILRHSHLKKLGNYVVLVLPTLRRIDLRHSKLLTKLPDLSGSPNLRWISLEGCASLLEILSSIQNLQNLTILNLKGCTNLRDLEDIGLLNRGDLLNNISQLSFTFFKRYISSTLMVFRAQISSKFPMNIKFLRLAGTEIEVVPSSIKYLSKLHLLDLRGCKRLKSVPTSICKLKYLQIMDLAECSKLKEFPEISKPMESLEILELSGAGIKKLPESIENLIALIRLRLIGCKDLESLPDTLHKLPKLNFLFLDRCSKLEKFHDLPSCLWAITFSNCERLKSATYRPSNIGNLNLKAGDLLSLIEAITSRTYPLTFKRDKFDWIGAQGLNLAPDSSNLDLNTHDYVANHPSLFMLHCSVQFVQQKSTNFFDQIALDGDNVESCYQGDEVPKQFSYQSLGSSISVTLPPYWNNNSLLGVAFCIVFHRSVIDPNVLVWINISIDHGQPRPKSEARFVDLAVAAVENYPDTVLTLYGSKIIDGKNWFCKPASVVTNVTYHVWPVFIDRRDWTPKDLGSTYCEIKKCGIRLVYMDDLEQYANFYAYLEASGNSDESLATGKSKKTVKLQMNHLLQEFEERDAFELSEKMIRTQLYSGDLFRDD